MKLAYPFSKLGLSRPWLIAIVVILAFSIVCVGLWFKVKSSSYAKTDPYIVSLTLDARAQETVFVAYDYGYGIQDQHIQRLVPEQESSDFVFSISAWKHVHALYIFAREHNRHRVTDLTVSKNGVQYRPELPESGPVLEGENWMYRVPLTDFNYRQ